jgi:citrate synthase
MTHVGSSLVDPYSAIAASAAALYGPLHGGANEAVIRMLEKIGKKENVPQFIEDVKARKTLEAKSSAKLQTRYITLQIPPNL